MHLLYERYIEKIEQGTYLDECSFQTYIFTISKVFYYFSYSALFDNDLYLLLNFSCLSNSSSQYSHENIQQYLCSQAIGLMHNPSFTACLLPPKDHWAEGTSREMPGVHSSQLIERFGIIER